MDVRRKADMIPVMHNTISATRKIRRVAYAYALESTTVEGSELRVVVDSPTLTAAISRTNAVKAAVSEAIKIANKLVDRREAIHPVNVPSPALECAVPDSSVFASTWELRGPQASR